MKHDRMRRFAFPLVLALIAYASMELAAYGFYLLTKREFGLTTIHKSMDEVSRSRDKADQFDKAGITVPWDVPLHPFFGSGNPSGFAFLEKETPAEADPTGAVVAITGGSVAQHMYRHAQEHIEKMILDSGVFGGRKVYTVLLGTGTWKQPQQLMSISYYLAMGGRLDVLVNLDGHNEVVDTRVNFDKGVYFAYPWLWYHLTSNVAADEELRMAGQIVFLRDIRAAAARAFKPLSFSVAATVTWSLVDRVIDGRIAILHERMTAWQSDQKDKLPAFRSGPKMQPASREDLLSYSAKLWGDASVQLHRLVMANGGRYFHFLQPNQYVEGSKPLSDEERQRFYLGPNPANAHAFARLQEESKSLRARGVDFVSLIYLFKDVEETVYADVCCHFNPRGSELLATAIARHVIESYRE